MSHEQRGPLWSDIHKSAQLKDFLRFYFRQNGLMSYCTWLEKNLRDNPYRLENPLYLPFVARTLLIAGEHQNPGITGHIKHHRLSGHTGDLLSPVYLLSLGIDLAKNTVRMNDQKAKILDAWRHAGKNIPENKDNFEILLTSWTRPKDSFPNTDEFLYEFLPRENIHGGRLDTLPILIPDIPFLRKVAAIPRRATLLQMDSDEFSRIVLPAVTDTFFSDHDHALAANMFLNDPTLHF